MGTIVAQYLALRYNRRTMTSENVVQSSITRGGTIILRLSSAVRRREASR
jgi:hypothetical protein